MPTKSILIGYDLNRPGQNYDELFEAIKAQGAWWHHLDSTWIVKSSKTVAQIRDALKEHIGSNDELLVVELTGVGAWTGFNDRGSKWLKDNL
jgi:hypothetical protein